MTAGNLYDGRTTTTPLHNHPSTYEYSTVRCIKIQVLQSAEEHRMALRQLEKRRILRAYIKPNKQRIEHNVANERYFGGFRFTFYISSIIKNTYTNGYGKRKRASDAHWRARGLPGSDLWAYWVVLLCVARELCAFRDRERTQLLVGGKEGTNMVTKTETHSQQTPNIVSECTHYTVNAIHC